MSLGKLQMAAGSGLNGFAGPALDFHDPLFQI
jgi:hypothetical protein